MNNTKSFVISKQSVWRAYELVKANKGSHGIDGQSIEDFEKDLKKNLYKIWNRMSAGTYFPPAVRGCEIDKRDGTKRLLGIPTVSDRIAQAVVKLYLEPITDPEFHDDSFGYRPKKSALQAVGLCKTRCHEYDWVLDLDIKGFFDNLDHDLVMRAVKKHTEESWVLLYIERWLKASMQLPDGTSVQRTKGTPQGGVISPLLANIFLHHAFDDWFEKRFPKLKFERYADDIVVHCQTHKETQFVKHTIRERLDLCKLELHPLKTKIIYCSDVFRDRSKFYMAKNPPAVSFDFLGFTFRRRSVKGPSGKIFDGFVPAISKEARKEIQETIRSWYFTHKTEKELEDLSKMFNPILRGWIQYYGAYGRNDLKFMNLQMNLILQRWAQRKYKPLHRKSAKAYQWLLRIMQEKPNLFATWKTFHGVGR